MAILIVVTSTITAQRSMQITYKRDEPELFLGKAARNVFLMKNNGRALLCAWNVKKRHPFYVDVYLSEELHDWQIPEPVRRGAEWKVEKRYGPYPVSEETLRKNSLASKEELEQIALDFSIK